MIKRALILYYSWSGTTAKMAQALQTISHAPTVELTVEPDTFSTDMYQTSDIAKQQLATNHLPLLTNQLPDLNDYDLLLIGGPVWSGEPATPVQQLLKQLPDNYTGTIAPFYTSAGGDQQYQTNFQKLTTAHVVNGLGLSSSNFSNETELIKNWWQQLN